MEDLKENGNKKSVKFLLLSNLGDDFTFDKKEVGVINHTVLCKHDNPEKNPVVLNKIWLWINKKYNKITHYWNGKQWSVINNELIRICKTETAITELDSTLVFIKSVNQELPAPINHKKLTIKNGSEYSITINGNIDSKENATIEILPKCSAVFHSSKKTWWIL